MKENDFAIVNPYSLYYVIKIRFALEKKNINSFCSKKEKQPLQLGCQMDIKITNLEILV